MHTDEYQIDPTLVRLLIDSQFPRWAGLDIRPVASAGTDNALFRLGADLVVRLPRHARAARQVEKEQRWLPILAPNLPFEIPVPLATGAAAASYPFSWSVCRWIEGANPSTARCNDDGMACDLARFILALQKIDAREGPPPGPHNFWRGVDLAARDAITRDAIAKLEGTIDVAAATAAWEADARAPAGSSAPVWIHGDLSAGNMLERDGRLCAVIDFGGAAVGDPACDLIVAWSLFAGEARAKFHHALAVDDACRARGRGWALSTALVALPYYRDTNPGLVAASKRVVEEVLADFSGQSC